MRILVEKPRWIARLGLAFILLFVLGPRPTLQAHAIGENYFFFDIRADKLVGRFEFSFEDLETYLKVEIDAETAAEKRQKAGENANRLRGYIIDRFSLEADGESLPIQFGSTSLLGDMPISEASSVESNEEEIAETDVSGFDLGGEDEVGRWVQYHFECPWESIPDVLTVDHTMMTEKDRFHRALLVVSNNAKTGIEYSEHHIVRVFGRHNPRQDLDLRGEIPSIIGPMDFVWQGILHIWIGIDHILFLVVLLLPAVLERKDGKWQPVARFRDGIWNVTKIVTLFTLAHSLTLALAALEIVNVPSAFVESVIAASIVVVALNNIWPKFRAGAATVIFGFGLFHGLGFASVMGELPFRMMHLKKVILAFNVGVELGQLAIVAIGFTALFFLRRFSWYRPVVLIVGSCLACVVAAVWFAERAFGL